MKLHLGPATAALAALLTPISASAGTLVDTGTPAGDTVWALSPAQSLAGYFNVATATSITGLEGHIESLDGGTVTATLYSDGFTPGAALFATTFAVGAGEGWKAASGLNWGVAAGNYWLGFASNNDLGMRNGALSPVAAYAFTQGGQWNRFDELDIGIRVFDAGLVPEPGTWALLLLGFGAIGAGMRSRQRTQVAVRFAV